MKIALFRCCMTSMGLSQYEISSNAVLRSLGIEFVDIKQFNCCGYPLRNLNFKAYLLSSARNLALAERAGLDILTICNCCYGSLRYAEHVLAENGAMRDEINTALATEGLEYNGGFSAKHFLSVLHDDIGVEAIKSRLTHTLEGLPVAVHYGCHLLRPKQVVGFENAFPPTKFDALLEATGAKSVPWVGKFDCCGSPLWGVNDELSMDLTEKKLRSAHDGGAECLTVTCPYCQMQFTKIQNLIVAGRNWDTPIPSMLYPQLLGLCLGIDPAALGLTDGLPVPVAVHLDKIGGENGGDRTGDRPQTGPPEPKPPRSHRRPSATARDSNEIRLSP